MELSDTLIFSIAPAWVEMIISGEKTVELRRRPPQSPLDAPALIYETSPKRRIAAFCRVGPVISAPVDQLWHKVGNRSGLGYAAFSGYFAGARFAHAVMLREVVTLKAPILLEELRAIVGFHPPQSWCRAKQELLDVVTARQ